MKRIVVAIFFVVVFVLPGSWYLILQFFGENKFDIPKFEKVAQECLIAKGGYLQLSEKGWGSKKNELKRIKDHFNTIDSALLQLVYDDACLGDTAAVLVDQEGYYRGFYQAERAETDRLLTEIDIYLTNIDNQSGERE